MENDVKRRKVWWNHHIEIVEKTLWYTFERGVYECDLRSQLNF